LPRTIDFQKARGDGLSRPEISVSFRSFQQQGERLQQGVAGSFSLHRKPGGDVALLEGHPFEQIAAIGLQHIPTGRPVQSLQGGVESQEVDRDFVQVQDDPRLVEADEIDADAKL
jgi:hypothetical protein